MESSRKTNQHLAGRLPQEERKLATTANRNAPKPTPAFSLVTHDAPPAGPTTGPLKMNGEAVTILQNTNHDCPAVD